MMPLRGLAMLVFATGIAAACGQAETGGFAPDLYPSMLAALAPTMRGVDLADGLGPWPPGTDVGPDSSVRNSRRLANLVACSFAFERLTEKGRTGEVGEHSALLPRLARLAAGKSVGELRLKMDRLVLIEDLARLRVEDPDAFRRAFDEARSRDPLLSEGEVDALAAHMRDVGSPSAGFREQNDLALWCGADVAALMTLGIACGSTLAGAPADPCADEIARFGERASRGSMARMRVVEAQSGSSVDQVLRALESGQALETVLGRQRQTMFRTEPVFRLHAREGRAWFRALLCAEEGRYLALPPESPAGSPPTIGRFEEMRDRWEAEEPLPSEQEFGVYLRAAAAYERFVQWVSPKVDSFGRRMAPPLDGLASLLDPKGLF